MTGSLFRVLFMASLGVLGAWAAFLFFPGVSLRVSNSDRASFVAAFPRRLPPATGEETKALAILPPSAFYLLPAPSSPFGAAASLTTRRFRAATRLIPIWMLFLSVGILAGALLRERLHWGTTYASPTLSFLSKRAGVAAHLVFFVWSLAPVPLPYWIVYPALLCAMAAGLGYVANLPLRL